MDPLLNQGVELMFIGMGIVFLFLILLVFATGAMSRLVNRYFPEPATPAAQPSRRVPAATVDAVPPAHLAAIREAVRQHRTRR